MDPKKDFIRMGWILLEYKLFYFKEECGLKLHPAWSKFRLISDDNYDNKEKQYIELGKILEITSQAALSDVSFDLSKASRRLVLSKMQSPPAGVDTWPQGYENLNSEEVGGKKEKTIEKIEKLLKKSNRQQA